MSNTLNGVAVGTLAAAGSGFLLFGYTRASDVLDGITWSAVAVGALLLIAVVEMVRRTPGVWR